MTKIFKRILKLKKKSGLTWAEIAELAGIPLKSWMTGLPTTEPTDEELKKLAPVFGVTYEYLKYGK
jgi:transcriptional regulator with XRE-family HTH domain